jgi:MFS family permease
MSPLRDRRFRALVVGQAVNGIGSWCALIAMWGYATERFDAEPWQVAVLGLTWTLPAFLIGPLAGLPTDRLDPRRVLIVADLAAAAVAVGMAMSSTYWTFVAVASLQSFAKAFAQPAFGALTPRIVEDHQLPRANALLGTAQQLSIAIGPLLGAVAIEAFGARGAFLVDAATYLVGVAVTVPLRLSPIARSARQGVFAEVAEGFRVVHARPAVRRLFVVGAGVYVTWGAGITLEPLYVRDVLERSPRTFAYLQTTFGIMLVLFGLVVGRVGDRASNLRALSYGAMAGGACLALYTATSTQAVAFIGIALWGAATPWFATPMRTLLQRATPPETHGRVFAVDELLRNACMAVATGTAGVMFGVIGAAGSGLLYGGIAVVGGVVALGGIRGVVAGRPGVQHAPGVDAGAVAVVPGDL